MKQGKEIDLLIELFSQHKDKEKAFWMSAYMKNHFPFLGIQKPVRVSIQKGWLTEMKEQDINTIHANVKILWQMPEREFQYLAMELMMACRKKWNTDSITVFEYMVLNKSWWDTVDLIASRMFGSYWKNNHEQHIPTIMNYATSDNIWLNRVAIIHQLSYKQQTNETLLTDIVLLVREKNEFFIQKAIGWALRQYSYTNPDFVIEFVEKYTLSNFSKREALKAIKRKVESN